MDSVRSVLVLLATYNGERFLRQQIDSILSQSFQALRILARDDGSGDGTVAILEDYALLYPERFSLMPATGSTGNAKWNFIRLLEAGLTAPAVEYFAFADQDDVWLPDKIALEVEAMQRLESEHGTTPPLMVFSDLRVVDQDLNTLHASYWRQQRLNPEHVHEFSRLLAQNVVTGCTIVLNRPLAHLSVTMPEEALMHDWWVAQLACALGKCAVVAEQTVLYRQHGGNVFGAPQQARPSGIPRWRYHEKRRAQWEMGKRQAEAMLRLHGNAMPPRLRTLLEAHARCETSPSRVVRAYTWLRYGFFFEGGLRPNLAVLWYLWDMKAAKAADAKVAL